MSEFYKFINEKKIVLEEGKKFPAGLLKKIKDDIEEEFTIYEEDIGDEYAEFLPSTTMLPNKWNQIEDFSEKMNKKYKDEGVEFSPSKMYYEKGREKSMISAIYVELTTPPKPVKKEKPLTQKQKDEIERKQKEWENHMLK
jgi:hypothetical protein